MITEYDTTTPIRKFHSGLAIFFKIQSHDERSKILCRLSLTQKEVSIDVVALEDWLTEKHGESENESMREVITKHYGKDACDFVESYFSSSLRKTLGDMF